MNKPSIRLVIRRTSQAPVEKVYRAWTSPSLIRQWFAPGDMRVPQATVDVRVGGSYRITMQKTAGKSHTTFGTYQEVIPNRRLVHTWQWEGSDEQTLVTVEFHALGEHSTELTLTHERFASDEDKDAHSKGWNGCLQKLEACLSASS